MLKIVSLNTNGARGNILYIENLIKNNDIVFCCEHWLNEKYSIKIRNKEYNTVFFSPMEQNKNKGRPWGGLCWLIKNKIRINGVRKK